MPRGTDQERADRSEEIQKHLFGAAEVPLEMAESAARLSYFLKRIAEIGNATLLSDLMTAVSLAGAAARGSSGMVLVNLRYMRDTDRADELQARLEAALRQGDEVGQQAVEIAERRA
jgi:formiminotetrahydrofolate cyclodeaminase